MQILFLTIESYPLYSVLRSHNAIAQKLGLQLQAWVILAAAPRALPQRLD